MDAESTTAKRWRPFLCGVPRTSSRWCRVAVFLCCLVSCTGRVAWAFQPQERNAISDVELRQRVTRALENGCAYLRAHQNGDGSWTPGPGAQWSGHPIGITSIVVLALINNDYPTDSPEVRRGLEYLRSVAPGEPSDRHAVYEASLMLMALCAAEDPNRDLGRIRRLATRLERTQATAGPSSGMWGYALSDSGGTPGINSEDRSNSQFALLALRDAAYYGIEIDRRVWERAHQSWLTSQLRNGGWSYRNEETRPRGSMTAAGLSSLAITSRMLQDDSDVDGEGNPDCCAPHPPVEAFERGRRWLGSPGIFSVNANPGASSNWHYYYLYGLERAGRLGNVRFIGRYDWYRAGARYLVAAQNGDGSWNDRSTPDPILNTAYALLFLSKGLSRVVVNKLDYVSPPDDEQTSADWNRHPLDVPNLIEKIDGLKGWPPRLTSQVLTLSRLKAETAVLDMNQAPVLYISGRDAPKLNDDHIQWLRQYVDEGGFIFAVANCQGGTFDQGLREIVRRMFPQGDASLQRLQSDHPVFRSEYALPDAASVELYGVDFGCRTAIIYSPEDLGCLWQKWMRHEPRGRHPGLSQSIIRATRIGVNVIAYATGREPPVKLNENLQDRKGRHQSIQRGLTEIAQLRHDGGWDTAPKALPNLLRALNQTAGLSVASDRRTIPITLEELRRFPIAYMHGRYRFRLSQQEQNALRDYLSRGAVLFADACCGSTRFDRSFRDLMQEIFPDRPLKPIPPDHEIFSEAIGYRIDRVKLRRLVPGKAGAALQTKTELVPPLLEGIEIDGRYAVIYSRFDISCALENQASLACDGYEKDDAMKLAVNIVLYAMLQDISWSAIADPPQQETAPLFPAPQTDPAPQTNSTP